MDFSSLRNLMRPAGDALFRAADSAHQTALGRRLETSRVVAVAILVVTVLAIVAVTYVGVSPAALVLRSGEVAGVRITAASDFRYTSELERERRADRVREAIAPVYRRDAAPFAAFAERLRRFEARLAEACAAIAALPEPEREAARALAADALAGAEGFRVDAGDIRALLAFGPGPARGEAIATVLQVVRSLHDAGLFEPGGDAMPDEAGTLVALAEGAEGATVPVPLEAALLRLRAHVAAENLPEGRGLAVYRLLREGLVPNLQFDREETRRRGDAAVAALAAPSIDVRRGQVMLEAGETVTREQAEMLRAYRAHLAETGGIVSDADEQLLPRIVLVLGLVVAAVLYLQLEDRRTLRSNSRVALLALVALANLGLVRLTVWLAHTPLLLGSPSTTAALPHFAPLLLAPLIVAILLGPGPGVFTGLLLSFFTGIIHGNRIDLMVIGFVGTIVAIHACRTIRQRARVVRAGTLGGAASAVGVLLLGLATGDAWADLALKCAAAVAAGAATGVAVVGLLPLLEALFQQTTDITLLELTDYNHPLLRRMQIEAPGTYHHSLVVSQLSENAAAAIGANALLCRVCALFHDIGKLSKPEFFAENQRGGYNPHDDHTPTMSALVIKSHVKEGVALAVQHRLPRPVIEVIRQHHGTSLIRFFHARARERRGEGDAEVPEEGFRYDGPKPQFKESAIIHLADSVEAAARTLKKFTPQAVAEAIERIAEEKIADGQLNACPLTFEEIARIQSSFAFTLLSMLHTRVQYPALAKPASRPRPARAAPPPDDPATRLGA